VPIVSSQEEPITRLDQKIISLAVLLRTPTNNFTFQVQMTIIQGSFGGIIFRQNQADLYYFRLGRDGMYALFSYKNGYSLKGVVLSQFFMLA